MSNQKKQWGAIVVMMALFAMIAFVTNLCNPMAVIIKSQGDVSNVLAQIGNYGNFIAYLIMGIPAGMLIAKFGYKRTALIGLIVGIVGILVQWLSGTFDASQNLGLVFTVYLIGAFISGFCMCILNCVVNPMLNILGGGGNSGNKLIQLGGVFNSSAAVACYILMGALIGEASKAKIADATPALMIALAIFVAAFFIIMFTKIEEPEQTKVDLSMVKGAMKYRHFALGALAIFLYMGIEVGVPTHVQQYLSADKAENIAKKTEILKQYENQQITLDEAAKQYVEVTFVQAEPEQVATENIAAQETEVAVATDAVEVAEATEVAVETNATQPEEQQVVAEETPAQPAEEAVKVAENTQDAEQLAVNEEFNKEVEKVKKDIEAGNITSAKEAGKDAGQGIPSGTVGMIIAVYWFMMLIGRLVGAGIGGKVSSRAMITTVSIATLVLVLFGMFAPSNVLVNFPGIDWGKLTIVWQEIPLGIFAFLLVGLCTSVMWGAIFNMAVEGLGKYTAIASGIFMTMVFGCAVMVAIQSFVADSFGYIPSFWVVVFCAAYLLFYALVGSKPKAVNEK